MTAAPRVTVLLPVHNGGPFLQAAVTSILGQSYGDFELLIIDDGSTDDSCRQLAALTDPRIRLVEQAENRGLAATLNLGIDLARGEYVARMDADDISLPERLGRQVAFLDENPEVGVCGTWLEAFTGSTRTVWPAPLHHAEIHARLLFESALYHPTVILRKAALVSHALRYAQDLRQAQDYELWSRCVSSFRLANLGEVLLRYRLHEGAASGRAPAVRQAAADAVRSRWLEQLGLNPDAAAVELHRQLSLGEIEASMTFLRRAHDWLLGIGRANEARGPFPREALSRELAARWFLACDRAVSLGPAVYGMYRRSPLAVGFPGKRRAVAALAVKCLLRWKGK